MARNATETWRARVDGQRNAGGSIAAYCAGQGFSTSSFYRWRKILAREDRPRARFLPVHIVEAKPVVVGPAGIDVVLRSGHRVKLMRGFDPASLRAAVIALEAARC